MYSLNKVIRALKLDGVYMFAVCNTTRFIVAGTVPQSLIAACGSPGVRVGYIVMHHRLDVVNSFLSKSACSSDGSCRMTLGMRPAQSTSTFTRTRP